MKTTIETKGGANRRKPRSRPVMCSAATSSIYFLRNGTWYLDCFNVKPAEVLDVIQSTYHRERRIAGFEGIKAEPDKPSMSKLKLPNADIRHGG